MSRSSRPAYPGRRRVLLAATALTGLAGLAAMTGAAQAATPVAAKAPTGAALVAPAKAPAGASVSVRTVANKARVAWFYDQLFNRGNVAVVDQLVRPDYIQHNPQAPDGSAALKQLVTGLKAQFPQSRAKVYRVLGEGDLVAVHSNVTLRPGDRGSAVVDIFRLQDGKIAEHWDVIQEVPETTASGNDMFSTLSAPRLPFPDPRSNPATTKRVGLALYTGLFVDKNVNALDAAAPTYIQHNPQFPNGTAVLKQAFGSVLTDPNFSVSPKRVIADGDFLLVHSHYFFAADAGVAVVDLWRVRDDKVVEHWDVLQPVPATSANDNTMF